jgi:hypothetical protein
MIVVSSGSHEFLPANIGWLSEILKIFFVSPMFGSELLVGRGRSAQGEASSRSFAAGGNRFV